MNQFEFTASSLEETRKIGLEIARQLTAPTAIALTGTLGAGKTQLARAILEGQGVNPEHVSSPTFTICQEYDGEKLKLFHVDLYRIQDDDELMELGPEQWVDGEGIALIEWADRFEWVLGSCQTEIELEPLGEESRIVRVRSQVLVEFSL